jgi:hypothetical protein
MSRSFKSICHLHDLHKGLEVPFSALFRQTSAAATILGTSRVPWPSRMGTVLRKGFPEGCGCILSSFGSAGWIARLIFFKPRLKVVTLRLRHLSALLQCFLLVALSVLSPSHPQAIQRWVTMTTTYGHLPERPSSGSLRLISIPASEPRASNDRGGTGDQALTIAQANNGPPTSSLPRCDCNGSLISNARN